MKSALWCSVSSLMNSCRGCAHYPVQVPSKHSLSSTRCTDIYRCIRQIHQRSAPSYLDEASACIRSRRRYCDAKTKGSELWSPLMRRASSRDPEIPTSVDEASSPRRHCGNSARLNRLTRHWFSRPQASHAWDGARGPFETRRHCRIGGYFGCCSAQTEILELEEHWVFLDSEPLGTVVSFEVPFNHVAWHWAFPRNYVKEWSIRNRSLCGSWDGKRAAHAGLERTRPP
jgi:hypothetical protein